ncbi:MAG: Uma2 family endonuclease [Prochlorothrix sp.]|nr:Uma2 family endonuclease [Prochlorothrix sp.]
MLNTIHPDRVRWSIGDYHRMIGAGILQNRRVELLNGEILAMVPESPLHYNTAKRGSRYLLEQLGDRAEVRFNGPVTLAQSEPEPDIAIVHGPESRYNDCYPGVNEIYWLIEVSQSSFQRDMEVKRQLYAMEGISEYWILNLTDRQLIVLQNPQGGNYQTVQVLTRGWVSPLAFPEVKLAVDRLLPTDSVNVTIKQKTSP